MNVNLTAKLLKATLKHIEQIYLKSFGRTINKVKPHSIIFYSL